MFVEKTSLRISGSRRQTEREKEREEEGKWRFKITYTVKCA